MIVEARFSDPNGEPFFLLFGDSYKRWETQYREYRRRMKSQ
jgi:hypothetical protein